MAVAIGKRVVGCDLFDKPSTCRKTWDRLLSGLVFDALGAKESGESAETSRPRAMRPGNRSAKARSTVRNSATASRRRRSRSTNYSFTEACWWGRERNGPSFFGFIFCLPRRVERTPDRSGIVANPRIFGQLND
jgi:hypothetical protein